jgi:transcription-repair coupling factor (superfamily II helicase)
MTRLHELLARYTAQPALAAYAQSLGAAPAGGRYAVSGAVGSQQAFVGAALIELSERGALFIAADREAALYLANDLELLLPSRDVRLFPATAKRAYQPEAVDNANVIERAEALLALTHAAPGHVVLVTTAEALSEKVIARQSLLQNTLELRVGERPGLSFVIEMLDTYGFEQVDFVYDPGHYAVRGGIVDVFGFGSEQPARIEFIGDEVETIRAFDASTQLSVDSVASVSIIPDVRTRLATEQRVSLLEYLSPATLVFTTDLRGALSELDSLYEKAENHHRLHLSETSDLTRAASPDQLFVDAATAKAQLKSYTLVELGRASTKDAITLEWPGSPQPTFKKHFDLLGEHLQQNAALGLSTVICCENEKQEHRLREVFAQIAKGLVFDTVHETLSEGFVDKALGLAVYTDHQIFDRYHRFRSRHGFSRSQALTLKELMTLKPGDYVAHVNHGIGRFAGLERRTQGDVETEVVRLIFADDDMLYVSVNALHKISKFAGKDGAVPRLHKLGTQEWARTKAKTKKRIKELAFDLVALYARRKATRAHAFSADSYLQDELEASFIYEDTPDQLKATEDVKADLMKPHPMDRLVCGDVGFGKTEIAVRAAFKAICEGKQVAVLVPTTILAMQHTRTFEERLSEFKPRIDFLNRFKSAAEQKVTLKKLAEGNVDIVIGTHRLLSKDVVFKEIGLLIIDEEHKFGVGAKEKLRVLRANVHTLTLTATPIPRTLQFSLLGIRDLSIIRTPPPNRKPVETVLHPFDSELIRDAIAYELKRRGQVFYVHNKIKDLEDQAAMIKRLVPDARVAIAHGQMEGEKVEEVMAKFVEGESDVLVCTTIIESGLDIPNANTIIVNQAHTYGLADLHQMRGRVGRSNRKAFAYLISPAISTLPTDARKRLQALEEFTDLGSGLQIALRDLDIRGAGDILGQEQSGFISEIGYDLYQRLLDEAVQELKAEHFLDLSTGSREVAADVQVEVDVPALLPDVYVPNVAERLALYKRIAETASDADLRELQLELIDRFGLLPAPTLNLFDSIRLRQAARELGFERTTFKGGTLRLYRSALRDDAYFRTGTFTALLDYLQRHPKTAALKHESDTLSVIVKQLESLKAAVALARSLSEAATHANASPVMPTVG